MTSESFLGSPRRRDLLHLAPPERFRTRQVEPDPYRSQLRSSRPRLRRSSDRPGKPELFTPHSTPPPAGVLAYHRAAFGPRPGDLDDFDALGTTDPERLQIWVDQQLDPAGIDDSDAENRIAASGYTTLNKTLQQLWVDHAVAEPPWQERIRPATETMLVTHLKAVYSRRQLFEVLADFWHNHFNVYAYDFWQGPVWVHYDRDVIRPHLLGNFRQMVEAVAKSTAMLFYLDNWLNSLDGPNENFARELLELHTLGAENYYGTIPRDQVPDGPGGVKVGFVDEDVFSVARCFTGWSISGDPWWDPYTGDGTFLYRHDWHEPAAKNVLGVDLPAGQGPEQDGHDVLDLLASHPGTGRFIAGKLCRRLIGDSPPQGVVDAAAAVFTSQAAAADQLAQVVRTILLSPAFLATWGDKVKRPFEIATSALRAGDADFPFVIDDEDTDTFRWLYYNTGQNLFSWHPPNGYPDSAEAWVTSSPRVMSWRLLNWLVDVTDPSGNRRLDAYAATPPQVRSANQLANFWIDRLLGRAMPAQERQEIVDFMAQGHNPDFDLPLDSDPEVRDRLQSMVGLVFMSPEFLRR